MRIRGYTLIDIQSWDKESGIVELDYDKMNCIIAPSETGKSVVIKILKEMCFPGNWGYTRRSLIRRGAECGQAVFFMEDDTAVIFKIWVSKVSYTLYDKTAENQMRVWEITNPAGAEIPPIIADHMGLIVDREGKTVINVLDKDMVTPFVNAPNELNQRILSVVTEVPELEARRKVLNDWKGQIEEVEKILKGKLHAVEKAYNEAPSIDVLKFEFTKKRAESLLDFMQILDLLLYDVNPDRFPEKPEEVYCPDLDSLIDAMNSVTGIEPDYDDLLSLNKPEEVIFNENLDPLMGCLSSIDDLSMVFNELLTTIKPEKVMFNSDVGVILECLDCITSVGKATKELCNTLDNSIKRVIEPASSIPAIDALSKDVYYIISTLATLCNLKEPKRSFDINRATTYVSLSKVIDKLDLDGFEVALNNLDEANSNLVKIETELESIRKELGVCPTCGKPW